MPTTIIINADDFGFSEGITDGILACHKGGILTSTTLMTTMPDRDRAIGLALKTPTLGVGIHLCLTQGVPLSRCAGLRNSDGTFPRSLPKLFLRLRKKAAQREARVEWSAQIKYALERGLTPTHVDSHKHVHHLPALHEAVMGAAEEHGILFVRTARETTPVGLPSPSLPYRMLRRYGEQLAVKLKGRGLKTTEWFFGLATTGRTDSAVWKALAGKMPEGLGEVMVHPGDVTGLTKQDTRLLEERVVEQKALMDVEVKQALEKAGVVLRHYGQV